MKIDFNGLKFRNWFYLMTFSFIILIVLWALQFAFMNSLYMNMKMNEMVRVGNQIVDEYNQNGYTTAIEDYAFRNNVRIVVLSEDGQVLQISSGFQADEQSSGLPSVFFPATEFDILKQKLESTDRAHYFVPSGRNDMAQMTYVARITAKDGTALYFHLSSPLPPISSTLAVLRTQFIIITVILLILSIIVAQIISRKMSVPIIKLTKAAEKLGKGDLDVNFGGSGYTEIEQLSSTLTYASQELSKTDSYRKEFVANVSHDLKTPLTIIKFYAEMILDVSGDNVQKRNEQCQTIIKEADWLAGMVNEILELSKLESNNVQISKDEVDLTKCLNDTLASMQVLCEKEGYAFETDIDSNITVHGSEQYLKRALYNLISNAINYTGDDKRIFISLKKLDQCVRFEVRDTGKGIPSNVIDSIWDRFYKSNEAHKRAVVGTGLGLSIVKHSLELHNARYGVISEEDRGTMFWFEMDNEI